MQTFLKSTGVLYKLPRSILLRDNILTIRPSATVSHQIQCTTYTTTITMLESVFQSICTSGWLVKTPDSDPGPREFTILWAKSCSETHTHTHTVSGKKWGMNSGQVTPAEIAAQTNLAWSQEFITHTERLWFLTHSRSELQHILVYTWSNTVTSSSPEGPLRQAGTSEQTLFLVTDTK